MTEYKSKIVYRGHNFIVKQEYLSSHTTNFCYTDTVYYRKRFMGIPYRKIEVLKIGWLL